MRIARVVLRSCLIALIGLFLLAGPAGADPAKPVDFKSTVLRLDPATDAVKLKVVGGDGFLTMDVQPGHEVIVQGYSGGPWLRVRADGVVEENQLSPATFLNANRYAQVTVPPNVTSDTEVHSPPEWKQVGTDGQFSWHDHRIHWMSPDDPPNTSRGQIVPGFDPWQVFFTVDGKPVVAQGQLVWEHAQNPIPSIALAIVACGLVIVIGRGKSTFVAAVAVGVSSLAALETGIIAYRSIPKTAGPNPLEIVLPAAALIAAIVGLVFHRKPVGVIAILASLAALAGWAIMRITVLFHPILPTDAAVLVRPRQHGAGTRLLAGGRGAGGAVGGARPETSRLRLRRRAGFGP